MKTKILITSAGSGVSQNVLETLINRRQNLCIVGIDVSPDSAVYACDRVYLCPKTELPPSEYAKFLSEIIADEQPDLVIPGRDIDVIILSILKKEHPEISAQFVSGSTNLAEMMEDKWLSYQFASKESLPFAESLICDVENNKEKIELFVEKFGFPLIVKPRKGFASKGVSVVLNMEQLYNSLSESNLIIQEYLGDGIKIKNLDHDIKNNGLPLFYSLEEEKFSLQCFIDRFGLLKGSFVTIHKMVNGVSAGVEIADKSVFSNLIQKFFKVFAKNGWYGPLNIQMQRSFKTGEFKAYELNGRFTGATAARYFLGYDEVGFAVEEVTGAHFVKDDRFDSQKSVRRQTYVSFIPERHSIYLKKNRRWES